MRVTATTDATLLDDARNLAALLAFGPDDLQTFVPGWEDASGTPFWATSFEASVEWMQAAGSALDRPEWDTENEVNETGAKRAQLLDFTIDAGSRLTGSGISATVDLAQTEDGEGEPVAHGISGGILTQTADLVRVTAAPAWTQGATWTETQTPGVDGGQAAYHTGSGAAEKILTRDASA